MNYTHCDPPKAASRHQLLAFLVFAALDVVRPEINFGFASAEQPFCSAADRNQVHFRPEFVMRGYVGFETSLKDIALEVRCI